MTVAPQPLDQLDDDELEALVQRAVAELSSRGTADSFAILIRLSGHVGATLGEAARTLAERGSWSQVAEVSGTTRQAAWSRWR